MVLTYSHMVSEQDTHVVHVALYQRTVEWKGKSGLFPNRRNMYSGKMAGRVISVFIGKQRP